MTPHTLFAPARRVGQGLLRTQSDDRLVDLARSGSEPAFEAIVARYRKPLLRYCVRLVTEQRAEEAVQESFVRAYGALMRGEEVRTLKPWLYRIAHNSALNTVRAKPLHLVDLDERIESRDSTETAAERSEDVRDVMSAMQALPLRQRDAIVQRELEGRSYEEIAVALGVSNGAVRQLLNRARTSLRAGAATIAAPFVPVAAGLGTGGGGVAAKVCATACMTGVLATGVAPSTEEAGSVPEREKSERSAAKAKPKKMVAAAPATHPVARPSTQPAAQPAVPVQPERNEAREPRSERVEHHEGDRPPPEEHGGHHTDDIRDLPDGAPTDRRDADEGSLTYSEHSPYAAPTGPGDGGWEPTPYPKGHR
jgi:RNA polymerase sigma factor (sigma-70 family)